MNSLKIPENGVMLKGSPGQDDSPLPQQAFAISLNDNVIEGMIKCVQDGKDIQLQLGANPTFHYGSKTHRISPPPNDHPYDLYLTQPFESVREAHQIPAMSLFRKPNLNKLPSKTRDSIPAKGSSSKPQTSQSSNNPSVSSLDSDIEALQNGLAAHDAAKERSVLLSGPLPTKKSSASKMKSKLAWANSTSRSHSTSPAMKPVPSPSTNPTLSSLERVKQQRQPLVHELAIGEQTTEHLRDKWQGKPEDFKSILEKVADLSPDTKKWALRKQYWKELDVWNYDYETNGDRRKAIDNAVKQFDKQRLSASEPEWEKLNAPEDRGKGICLSVLQKKVAGGPPPPGPTIKVQRAADDSSTSKDDGEVVVQTSKAKASGEGMARSSSNPLPKAKKISGSEAQAKRLLGNSKTKSTTTTTTKASPKTSPAKSKTAGTKSNGGRVLSQEFIENSDSSGDEIVIEPVAKPKQAPKPAPKSSAVEKPAVKPAEKGAAAAKTRPVAKPAPKRPLEDDDSSSSSGTPLSKRIKPKQPLPSQPLKNRPVDSRQVPLDAGTAPYGRSKNNSPTKSSPLASSPPTNASDISEEGPPVSKKRKPNGEDKAPPAKRRAADPVPTDVMSQAAKFKAVYREYEALHWEISALDNPPQDKLTDLRDMRERLAHMKQEIYKKYRG